MRVRKKELLIPQTKKKTDAGKKRVCGSSHLSGQMQQRLATAKQMDNVSTEQHLDGERERENEWK